jgi:hypothetical protein
MKLGEQARVEAVRDTVTTDGNQGWTRHRGSVCHVAPEQKVKVRYRNGVESDTVVVRERRWEAWPRDVVESDWDIVEWRAVRE